MILPAYICYIIHEVKYMLKENYASVEARIQAACERSGRNRGSVTLIAVSKTKPSDMIREIYDLGQRDFGENRPQELRDKSGELPQDIRWHMIGHLQKNKIKYVVGRAVMIHSIDSRDLADAVSREAQKQGVTVPVLLEVNVAGEDTKFGIAPEEAESLARYTAALPGLRVEGLMTIAPFVDDPELNRPVFRKLKQLSVDIAMENIDNVFMNVLSMGMTNDYETAIEEGATMVRVGTGIFGEREYPVSV